MQEERIARRFFVSGIVQGVGFRHFANRVALRLGVAGYARNLANGRVEIYAVGSPATLTALRSELERGPSGAAIERVVEEQAGVEPECAGDFSIRYDG